MKATGNTHQKDSSSLDDGGLPPQERQSRKSLAGLPIEQQLQSVKPPEQDGAVKENTGAASFFDGIDIFDAVISDGVLLRYGCPHKEAVTALQKALNAMGFNVGKPDGLWGPMTQQGILQFQSANGLSPDGVIGPNTMSVLNSEADGVSEPPDVETVETKGNKQEPPTEDKPEKTAKAEPPLGKTKPPEQKEEPPLPQQEKPKDEKPPADKPQKQISSEGLAGIFQKLQDPELPPKELAKLQSELQSALGIPQLAAANEQSKKVSEGQQSGDPRAKVLQMLQATLAWYAVNRPTLKLTEKEAVAIQLRLENLVDFYQRMVSGEYDQPVSGLRAAIVSTALSRIGAVESHTPAGEGKFGKTRYGWEFLDQVFERSYGGRMGSLDENDNLVKKTNPSEKDQNSKYNKNRQLSVKYHTFQGNVVDMESWCSHYAMWALKSNGVSPGDWPSVDLTSIATNRPSKSSYKPRPGDIAYSHNNRQHYAIIVRVDGNTIHTIDGNTNGGVNSTAGGKILPVARYRDWWSNFYELNV